MITRSLCPICKENISATIHVGDKVVLNKTCAKHGNFSGIIENSVDWFKFCRQNNTHKIYDGLMIDITSKCNLKCKYCYHNNVGNDFDTQSILEQMAKNKHLAPFILTGGEPTLHPDIENILSEASKTGQFWLLTNGVKLSEPDFFHKLLPYLDCNGILMVGLSFHKESKGKDRAFLDLCRENVKQIGTAFYVIDDISQMDEAINVLNEYSDIIWSFRIKAASNLGNEIGAKTQIFTSEMVDYIISKGGKIDTRYSNKVSYASMLLNGKEIRLISWYNINNVDLIDIDGPPYYRSKNGELHNLVTTCLLDGKNV